jgi:hypothetical protein
VSWCAVEFWKAVDREGSVAWSRVHLHLWQAPTMTSDSIDPFRPAQHDLAAWHSTQPRATLVEIEAAAEEQIARVRARLLENWTKTGFQEKHPTCQRCGTTTLPHTSTNAPCPRAKMGGSGRGDSTGRELGADVIDGVGRWARRFARGSHRSSPGGLGVCQRVP